MEKYFWRNLEIYFFVLDFLGLINFGYEYLVGLYFIYLEVDIKLIWKKFKVIKGSLIFYNFDIRIFIIFENLDFFFWYISIYFKKIIFLLYLYRFLYSLFLF